MQRHDKSLFKRLLVVAVVSTWLYIIVYDSISVRYLAKYDVWHLCNWQNLLYSSSSWTGIVKYLVKYDVCLKSLQWQTCFIPAHLEQFVCTTCPTRTLYWTKYFWGFTSSTKYIPYCNSKSLLVMFPTYPVFLLFSTILPTYTLFHRENNRNVSACYRARNSVSHTFKKGSGRIKDASWSIEMRQSVGKESLESILCTGTQIDSTFTYHTLERFHHQSLCHKANFNSCKSNQIPDSKTLASIIAYASIHTLLDENMVKLSSGGFGARLCFRVWVSFKENQCQGSVQD